MEYSYLTNVRQKETESKSLDDIIEITKSDKVKDACLRILKARQAGDEKLASDIKSKELPAVVWNRNFGTGNPVKKNTGEPTGCVPMDIDCDETMPFSEQNKWTNDLVVRIKELVLTNDFVKEHLLMAHISPRRKGVHLIWHWVDGCTSVKEVQDKAIEETGLPAYDPSCTDNSRKSFLVSDDMNFFISEKMYHVEYYADMQKNQENASGIGSGMKSKVKFDVNKKVSGATDSIAKKENENVEYPTSYCNIPYERIIKSLVSEVCPKGELTDDGEPVEGHRHTAWVKVCSHIRSIVDNNPDWLYQIAPMWALESGSDVMACCNYACNEQPMYGDTKTIRKVINNLKNEIEADDEKKSKTLVKTWAEDFRSLHKMPELPPLFDKIIGGCPKGYEEPMLLHLISMFGALCFSMLRAEYLDGEIHSPSLQVVIEGTWSSGKGKFESVFNKLFERLIEKDMKKLALEAAWDEKADRTASNKDLDEKPHQIVQIGGIKITKSKLQDVLCDNKHVHMYIFESEIKAVNDALHSGYGLTYEHLRKAFENGMVYQNTKSRQSKTGMNSVYMNYTFTGTPVDIDKFIGKELEGGTASRICWTVIPECGRQLPRLNMPKGDELDEIRDQIDTWNRQFCYDIVDDVDTPAVEQILDLDYVSDQLNDWILQQYDLGEAEGNSARKDARARMAAIAFHCAIVLHAMFGFPDAKKKSTRQKVCNLTRYIANYCMERFLHKFSESQNEQRLASRKAEKMHCSDFILHRIHKKYFTRDEFKVAVKEAGFSDSGANIRQKLHDFTKKHLIEETKNGKYKIIY